MGGDPVNTPDCSSLSYSRKGRDTGNQDFNLFGDGGKITSSGKTRFSDNTKKVLVVFFLELFEQRLILLVETDERRRLRRQSFW